MAIQDPLTGVIIGCCFKVANELGNGFLEKVYENALAHELPKAEVKVVHLINFGKAGSGTPQASGRPDGCLPSARNGR